MPALRRLELKGLTASKKAAHALFAGGAWARLEALSIDLNYEGRASGATAALLHAAAPAAPRVRELTLCNVEDAAALSALAASGWRLEALHLANLARALDDADVAALFAAPAFSVRRVSITHGSLGAAAISALAAAPWPLEEVGIHCVDLSNNCAAGPALVALSQRHPGLRRLALDVCHLAPSALRALVGATWPALTELRLAWSRLEELDGPSFANFPQLQKLWLSSGRFGEAGARALAGGRWRHLRELRLYSLHLGDAGLAALERGEFPALESLELSWNGLSAMPTLEAARRLAPALVELMGEQEQA